MPEEIGRLVAEQTGTSRRSFLLKLLAGAVFVPPAVASFTLGGGVVQASTSFTQQSSNQVGGPPQFGSNQVSGPPFGPNPTPGVPRRPRRA